MSGSNGWDSLPPERAAENTGPQLLIIGWVFTSLATLFVAGRIFSRFKKLSRIGIGDYLVLFSLALGFIYMALITVAVQAGLGRHIMTLTTPNAERTLLFATIGFIPGILSYTIPKFAVVLLIIDLLSPSQQHIAAIWTLAAVTFVLHVLCITFTYVQCHPVGALWTMGILPECWNPMVLIGTSIAAGALSALFDFWMALYPAVVLWWMDIHRRKKIALSSALGFGVTAGSVAVYKCTTFNIAGGNGYGDLTYSTVDLIIWTSIEANSVIISACIPMLMPLVEIIFGENFLNGGEADIHLPTIESVHERENTSDNSDVGVKASAKGREDWRKRFQGGEPQEVA